MNRSGYPLAPFQPLSSWNQEDETVYDYAAFLQEPVSKLREREKDVKK